MYAVFKKRIKQTMQHGSSFCACAKRRGSRLKYCVSENRLPYLLKPGAEKENIVLNKAQPVCHFSDAVMKRNNKQRETIIKTWNIYGDIVEIVLKLYVDKIFVEKHNFSFENKAKQPGEATSAFAQMLKEK